MSNNENPNKYTGMRDFNFELNTNVYICAVAGAVLGAILAYWGTDQTEIVVASSFVFAILSGIFGMFV